MNRLVLYSAEICPYAQRTRIVLHEKSIAHEVVEIDLDDKPEWLGELTPTRRVPVIRHDDFVLWESATVNEYLDGTFAGTALRPGDERGRAVMRNEIRHFDSVFLPTLYKLLFEQDADEQARLREQTERGFEFLEQRLEAIQGGGPYWLGAQMSLADASMWPFFERLGVFEHYRKLGGAAVGLRPLASLVRHRRGAGLSAIDDDARPRLFSAALCALCERHRRWLVGAGLSRRRGQLNGGKPELGLLFLVAAHSQHQIAAVIEGWPTGRR